MNCFTRLRVDVNDMGLVDKDTLNKVQNSGSNRDFGTTKAAKMYFSMSEPSPENSRFPQTEVTPPSFN